MLITGEEHRNPPIDINVGGLLRPVTFSANGEYLLSNGEEGVRVWRVKDGEQVATMVTGVVLCLAVSKDSRWIAAGTSLGDVFVGNAETRKFSHTRRISTTPTESTSRLTRLTSSLHRITKQPPSGKLKLANEYEHSTTNMD